MPPAGQLAWYDAVHLAVRKLAHFSEFTLLGALTANLFVRMSSVRAAACAASTRRGQIRPLDTRPKPQRRPEIPHPGSPASTPTLALAQLKPYAIAWTFSAVYAISDEVHQLFVPGRACMPLDVLIDASGALAGIAIFAFSIKLFARP